MPSEQTSQEINWVFYPLSLFVIKALLGNQVILIGDERQCFTVLGILNPSIIFSYFSKLLAISFASSAEIDNFWATTHFSATFEEACSNVFHFPSIKVFAIYHQEISK